MKTLLLNFFSKKGSYVVALVFASLFYFVLFKKVSSINYQPKLLKSKFISVDITRTKPEIKEKKVRTELKEPPKKEVKPKEKVVPLKKLPPSNVKMAKKITTPPKIQPKIIGGISKQSISNHSDGPAVMVGNTLFKAPPKKVVDPAEVTPILDNTGDEPPGDNTEAKNLSITEVTTKPVRIKEAIPHYPQGEKEKGVQGSVILQLLIDRSGRVADAKLVKGLSAALNQEALKAAKMLLFKPALMKNMPVATTIVYTFHFRLED